MKTMTFAAAIAALVLAAALSPASSADPGPASGQPGRRGGTLRVMSYAREFNPDFDPALADAHFFIVEQLFDGLVRLDADFNVLPSLAEYWEITEEGTRFTFYLRRGVRFHDGTELTAEDVKFSLERLLRQGPRTTIAREFADKVVGAREFWEGRAPDVAGFMASGPRTFDIVWTRPSVSGLYFLSMSFCRILPRARLERDGRDFFRKPIGTGPFRFDQWLRSPRLDVVGVRLERNPDYFGRKAWLNALEYSPHFTTEQFRQGEVHMMPPMDADLLRGRYTVLENASLRFVLLGMSCNLPPLDRPAVRRAIALALDKAALAEAAAVPAVHNQVSHNFIPPQLPGFFPRPAAAADPAAARALLADAGVLDGAPAAVLTLCFLLPRQETHRRIFQALEDQLGPLGFELRQRYVRTLDEFAALDTPFLAWIEVNMDFPDPGNVIGPVFASGAALNAACLRYANPGLDELFARAEGEVNTQRRVQLFRKMEELLFEEAPAVPLYGMRVRLALQPEVRGARMPSLGFSFLRAEDLWMDR